MSVTERLPDDAHAAGVQTLVDLLEYRAARQPAHTVFRFINGDGRDEDALTFATLLRRARAIAAHLAEHVVPGDRVVLLVPPGLEYVAAFFGCLYAGVVAVPAYPPNPRRADPRVARIFVFAGAKVEMCANATGDRSWLHKIRPWYGHNYHFHVRLNCPAGAAGCVDQDPIPAGDGCADAQEWVNNILNPPPPDPNAPPVQPSQPVTMANLPGQCLDVLNSD